MSHESVLIAPPDPRIEIDKKMIGLIRQCWRLGLQTRACCQGDLGHEAYISFTSHLDAVCFAGAAGPIAWSDKVHRQRDHEKTAEMWKWAWWRWRLEGHVVRFPTRDIDRAEKSLSTYGALVRIGANTTADDARRTAPRLCPTCGGAVIGRRQDAKFCSRRCQLAARQRGQRKSR